jgi:ubiquitin C-terminal hydrolase
LSQLEEKITDDVFNELSEQGKLLYSDFVTRVNNIVAEVNQTLYNQNFKDDIDVYRSQLSEADKLSEEFDQFLKDLRADYNQARLKAAQ